MAKEICRSCEARLAGTPSFCPACGQPTGFASDAERLEWDLKQWRLHVDRSVAAGVNPGGHPNGHRPAATLATVSPTEVVAPAPLPALELGASRERSDEAPAAAARVAAHGVRMPRLRLDRLRRDRAPRERVIDLDARADFDADAFAYRVCPTCDDADWILRLTQNDDQTWSYWCVRCSRSFKTEVKLSHAWKPFLSAAIVVGGLLAATFLMLR
jgi:predicted RNA-binding Zn-ribbon protein involved in translation (DUF1610 family)